MRFEHKISFAKVLHLMPFAEIFSFQVLPSSKKKGQACFETRYLLIGTKNMLILNSSGNMLHIFKFSKFRVNPFESSFFVKVNAAHIVTFNRHYPGIQIFDFKLEPVYSIESNFNASVMSLNKFEIAFGNFFTRCPEITINIYNYSTIRFTKKVASINTIDFQSYFQPSEYNGNKPFVFDYLDFNEKFFFLNAYSLHSAENHIGFILVNRSDCNLFRYFRVNSFTNSFYFNDNQLTLASYFTKPPYLDFYSSPMQIQCGPLPPINNNNSLLYHPATQKLTLITKVNKHNSFIEFYEY